MDCANFDQHMTCLEDSNSTGTLKKPILMIAFITEGTKTFDNTLVTKNQGFWPKNITKGCFECFYALVSFWITKFVENINQEIEEDILQFDRFK